MAESMIVALMAIGGAVGVLIGAFGIGGVLLAPCLIYLLEVPPHTAIAVCMVGYVTSGAVGSIGYLKRESIERREAIPLVVGAIPGALFGALSLAYLPAIALEFVLAALLLFAGWRSLRGAAIDRVANSSHWSNGWTLGLLGAGTGAVSALSGTGGPVTLIPCLLLLGWAPLGAIGLSQVIQIPVSLAATTGNAIAGEIDWPMAAVLAIALGCGAWAGVKFSHSLPAFMLRSALALLTFGCGLALSGLLFWRLAAN